MIERPPKIQEQELLKCIFNPNLGLKGLIRRINDEYSYWSKVKYTPNLPQGVTPRSLWMHVKVSRMNAHVEAWGRYGVHFGLTDYMQRVCQQLDMHIGGLWGQEYISSSSEQQSYLASSIMEEAISSSQMEGASTTRKVAKDMLRKDRKPQDKAQQMILNNYKAINFILEHQAEPLSLELLLQLHDVMTEGTLERPEDAGRLRTDTDDVVVEDSLTHEVVHRPPSSQDLESFATELCAFFNNEDKDAPYMHPIIRAIVIHFMIGYMHPFVDGNGRTARALFYWYMMKQGYWLMQYLSISRIILRSKNSYERAYLYAEQDGLDMGYFITYHLRALELSFRELEAYIARKRMQRSNAQLYIQLQGVNERQAMLVQLYKEKPDLMLTAKEVQGRFNVAPATAKADLDGLVDLGVVERIDLNKVKRGYIRSACFEDMIAQAKKVSDRRPS